LPTFSGEIIANIFTQCTVHREHGQNSQEGTEHCQHIQID
jgi:hypothetical protein